MQALSPRLKQLDDRLAALPDSCDAMMLSELDGYLAGVLVCPEMILPSEWLPGVWGGDEEDVAPVFDRPFAVWLLTEFEDITS